MPDRHMLQRISIDGWKTLHGQSSKLALGSINVLIGANGVGKSNFVSFFQLLSEMVRGGLQGFLVDQGLADRVLPYGGKKTSRISSRLIFRDDEMTHAYETVLARDETDGLFVEEERISYFEDGQTIPCEIELGCAARESALSAKTGLDTTCRTMRALISSFRTYQFQERTPAAKFRSNAYRYDNRSLHSDGSNLAAFLRRLALVDKWRPYYDEIVRQIRRVIPVFGDFAIGAVVEHEDQVRLDWKERGSDYVFSPEQLTDRTIRFMTLATLFLQPPELQPAIIIVDEPELGLHPAAMASLARMVKAAAKTSQVILTAQSPQFIERFEAEDVIVVERCPGEAPSMFRRLDEDSLGQWLDAYRKTAFIYGRD